MASQDSGRESLAAARRLRRVFPQSRGGKKTGKSLAEAGAEESRFTKVDEPLKFQVGD